MLITDDVVDVEAECGKTTGGAWEDRRAAIILPCLFLSYIDL